VLLNVVTAGADWVATRAVGAEDGSVLVQARKVIRAAGIRALAGAVKDVVGLVSCVQNVAEEGNGSNLSEELVAFKLKCRREGRLLI
jgi:hypothetical protein